MPRVNIHVDKYHRGDGTPVSQHNKNVSVSSVLSGNGFHKDDSEPNFQEKEIVYPKKNYSVEEELRQVKLRRREIGTFEEQEEARKNHNIKMREMNKEAREMGYGGGMNQVVRENRIKERLERSNRDNIIKKQIKESEEETRKLQEEEASENISDILAKQRIKERGRFSLD